MFRECTRNEEFTEHDRINVYIATFLMAYAQMTLNEVPLEASDNRVLYFDTDSVVYILKLLNI